LKTATLSALIWAALIGQVFEGWPNKGRLIRAKKFGQKQKKWPILKTIQPTTTYF